MTMHSRGQNSTSSGPSKPYPDFIPLSQPSSGIGASGSRSQGQRKNEKKRKHPASPAVGGDDDPMHTPWLDSLGMTEYESKEQRLHDEIVAYVAYIAPTQAETSARHFVITHLHEVIKRRFRDAALRMFGSVVHQVCLPDGDIDLVLETVHVVDTKEDQKRALFQLRNRIRDAQLANDIQVVGQARVPIINLKTTPQYGSFDVDISINNTDGVHAIDIISSYMTSIPALRPLLFTLKGFLSQRQLNSAASSTLSSYCLICMVISFLQLNPTKRPQEWLEKHMENESLGQLLLDFFYYYGWTFPYATSAISVTDGKLVSKEEKGWFNSKQPEALSIQCLIYPDRDIGRSATRIDHVRNAFRQAFDTLNNLPFDTTLTSWNILGNIMGVTQRTIDRRAHIQHLVDSGEIQRRPALPNIPPPTLRYPLPPPPPPPRNYSSGYNPPYVRPSPYPPTNNNNYHKGRQEHSHGASHYYDRPPPPPPPYPPRYGQARDSRQYGERGGRYDEGGGYGYGYGEGYGSGGMYSDRSSRPVVTRELLEKSRKKQRRDG